MIETFDKEGNGRRWKLVVISQQQWQEADCNVFKLPRPWKTNQFSQIVMTLAFNKLNFNPQNSTHMFLLLMQYSRSSISCWYFLWICWTILLLASLVSNANWNSAQSCSKKSFWHFLLSVWTYWTDSVFFCSCFFRPSSTSSSDRAGSAGQGFPLIISCFATVQHSLGI